MHIYIKHILYISYNTYAHTLKACKHFFLYLHYVLGWFIKYIFYLWSFGVTSQVCSGLTGVGSQTWTSKQESLPGVPFPVGISGQCAVQSRNQCLVSSSECESLTSVQFSHSHLFSSGRRQLPHLRQTLKDCADGRRYHTAFIFSRDTGEKTIIKDLRMVPVFTSSNNPVTSA